MSMGVQKTEPEPEILVIQARQAARDPQNGLGDRFNPDWDYIIYPRLTAGGRFDQGWAYVADISGSSGEDMIMLGRPKAAKETK